uniref:Uncharacterized protein n=1 Tax=Anopheles funestus TaxID=62324 RepID=A0A182S0P0_ANOFN
MNNVFAQELTKKEVELNRRTEPTVIAASIVAVMISSYYHMTWLVASVWLKSNGGHDFSAGVFVMAYMTPRGATAMADSW